MIASHTTPDGYKLTVYEGSSVDSYGLLIEDKDGEDIFDHQCFLCADHYGFHEEESDDENNPGSIIVFWDEEMWENALADEANDLLEIALPCEDDEELFKNVN